MKKFGIERISILINILFIIYILLVCYLCFAKIPLNGVQLDKLFYGIRLDRIAHFIMFFPFPIITWLTMKLDNRFNRFPILNNKLFSLLITVLSGIFLAIITEFTQYFLLKSREGDYIDLIADIIAVLCGTFVIALIGPRIIKLLEYKL